MTVLRDVRAPVDSDLALKAIDRIHRQIELQAQLLGGLDERPVINVLVTPEWQALRGRIVAALRPHPAVAVALADVLGDVG